MSSPIGQPVKNPLIGLEMTSETALYVGVLEAQLAAYAVNEAKYRALLELLTDEPWDTTKVDVDGKILQDIAVEALTKRGIDRIKAKTVVAQRWNKHNAEVVPTTKAMPLEQDSLVTAAESNPPLQVPMRERLAEYKQRRFGTDVPESQSGTSVPE